MTFVVDRNKRIVAQYTGATDPAVEDNPLDYLDRVILHTGLPYVQAVQQVSGSMAMTAPVGNAYGLVSEINLFAHGLNYVPLVLPFLKNVYDIDGTLWDRVSASGSAPNWKVNPETKQSGETVGLTSIFSDGTHVKAITFFEPGGSYVRIPTTVEYEVYVTNVALEGQVINPPTASQVILIDQDEITIDGKFSSHATHFSQGGTGIVIPMPNQWSLNQEIYGFLSFAFTQGAQKFISSPGGVSDGKSLVLQGAAAMTGVVKELRVNGT